MYLSIPAVSISLVSAVRAIIADLSESEPAAPAAPRARRSRRTPRVGVAPGTNRNLLVISQRDDVVLVQRQDARRLARALLRAARN